MFKNFRDSAQAKPQKEKQKMEGEHEKKDGSRGRSGGRHKKKKDGGRGRSGGRHKAQKDGGRAREKSHSGGRTTIAIASDACLPAARFLKTGYYVVWFDHKTRKCKFCKKYSSSKELKNIAKRTRRAAREGEAM